MKIIKRLSFFLLAIGLVISCKPKGDNAGAGDSEAVSAASGKEYNVNKATSILMWEAAKVTGKHNGTVNLSEGKVIIAEGLLVGGSFTLDMNTITDLDLEGDGKENLEKHLKGTAEGKEDDFFNVVKYPTAKFEITKATKLMGNDDANYVVNGNLTIKDVTKQISFRAMVTEEAGKVTVSTPQFLIDRTEWGVKFRSLKFFADVADKAISDEVGFIVNLSAE